VIITKTRKREYFNHGSISLGCEIDTQFNACEPCAEKATEPEVVNFSIGVSDQPLRSTMRTTRWPTPEELAETNVMSKPAPKEFKIKEKWDG